MTRVRYEYTDAQGHKDELALSADTPEQAHEKAKKLIKQLGGNRAKLLKEVEMPGL